MTSCPLCVTSGTPRHHSFLTAVLVYDITDLLGTSLRVIPRWFHVTEGRSSPCGQQFECMNSTEDLAPTKPGCFRSTDRTTRPLHDLQFCHLLGGLHHVGTN
ncbi:hypothetical protein FKM82_010644 [Ascaphus truei]